MNGLTLNNIVFNHTYRAQEATVIFQPIEVKAGALLKCNVIIKLGDKQLGNDELTTLLPTYANAALFFENALKKKV
jgi:hypothetical protein